MEDFSLLISGLEYKVRMLIEKKKLHEEKIQEMSDFLNTLQAENEKIKLELDTIQREKNLLELSGSVLRSKDSRKLKLLINEYIKEIDRSIAYLNNN